MECTVQLGPGTATASSTFGGNFPAHAFDNNTTTGWGNNNIIPAWLQYDLGSAAEVCGYSVRFNFITSWTSLGFAPKDWTLQGSDDGTSWTTVDTRTGQVFADPETKTYALGSPASYRYWRINITKNNNNQTSTGYVLVVEMELYAKAPVVLVRGVLDQSWHLALLRRAECVQPWGDAPVLRAECVQPWGDAPVLRAELVQRWASAHVARGALIQPWAVADLARGALVQPWAITSTLARGELGQPWDLRERDLLRAELVQRWALAAGAEDLAAGGVLTYQVEVLVDGVPVGVRSITIEGGLDQDSIHAEIEIGTEADYLRCTLGAPVAITLTTADGVDQVALVVTAPRISEQWGAVQYLVEAGSPAVLLDHPHAAPVKGELSGLASAIAAALAAPVAIAWQTVDWEIPAGVWIASGDSPLALLKQLAGAVGAVLQSQPDGSLAVLPEYPLAVPSWPTATPDAVLVEILDCWTTGATPELRDGYNQYLISSGSAGSALGVRLEEIEIGPQLKEVRGYQVPWTGDLPLIHTGGPWVSIEDLGVEIRTEVEEVEIVAGAGRTRFPILAIQAVDWREVELGAVSCAEDGSLTAATGAESMLAITYTTRCRLWRVRDPLAEQVQMVVPEAAA